MILCIYQIVEGVMKMELRRFDTELKKLQARKFGSDVEALSELCRFSMFASACGYRGKVIYLTVKDKKIVQWPYRIPKPTLRSQKVETTQAVEPKKEPVITVPAIRPQVPHQVEETFKEQLEEAEVADGEGKLKASQQVNPKKNQKPLMRKGGPKPRALKREKKKGKMKKRKSRSSSGYRR